ncbi:MAG: type II CAAX endopeptidase family protein [Dehalococcoidales bacterium]|nr:type II CAAX endopeptidase family protein [Dehalococcoidales bacterium]
MVTIKQNMPVSRKAYVVLVIAGICSSITLCEWIFAYQNVTYGIVLALVVALATYLVIPLTRLGPELNNCAESLALIPLYILFTSSLPWFFLRQEFLLPAVYSTILLLCAWHIYRKNISLKDIGFNRRKLWQNILLGVLFGIPLGMGEYFIITPVATYPTFTVSYLIRDLVYMVVFVGLGEELLFRGLVQRDMTTIWGWKWGLLGASVMFMVMHLTWRSIPELGFTFLAGLVFGYLYYRTHSLTAAILAHGVGNTILVAVMPYLFH